MTQGAAIPPLPPSHAPQPGLGGRGTAALKHSIEEPAGQSPGQGQSWAAPSASSSSAAFRLPKKSKNENPKAKAQPGWAPRCTLQRAVIALHSPGRQGRAGAELLGLSPPRAPLASLAPGHRAEAPWGRAGGAGPAWGMWGCFKSHDQPQVGAQPGGMGGEGRAAPQPLPWARWEGRVGQEPPQRRHSGPQHDASSQEGTSHR